jgi:hypothetical protein
VAINDRLWSFAGTLADVNDKFFGESQTDWVNKASNALTDAIAKPVAKALDPGKTAAGAFKATGKAVVGSFVAAGSMVVAAEAVASGVVVAGITKIGGIVSTGVATVGTMANKGISTVMPYMGERGINAAAGAGKAIVVRGMNDIIEGQASPVHKYVRSAASGAAWGYALNSAPASIDVNKSMGKVTTGLWWVP